MNGVYSECYLHFAQVARLYYCQFDLHTSCQLVTLAKLTWYQNCYFAFHGVIHELEG